jgi:hypothetical protein
MPTFLRKDSGTKKFGHGGKNMFLLGCGHVVWVAPHYYRNGKRYVHKFVNCKLCKTELSEIKNQFSLQASV